MTISTMIDLVTPGVSPNQWLVVLVEEGPWTPPVDWALRSLKERMYGAVDIILDGLLAKSYPETMGKDIVIRVEGFDLPHVEVGTFFTRVSQRMFLAEEYREALRDSRFVSSITFEILFDYSVEGSTTH